MLCAWCLERQGIPVQEKDSHGICKECADYELLKYYWDRLQKVPSYIECQAALFVIDCSELLKGKLHSNV